MYLTVYTCISGNYDQLLPPRVRHGNIRYCCFTDQEGVAAEGWEILPLCHPPGITRPDLVNRYHKVFPHRVLSDCRWSVYVDGNLHLTKDISELAALVASTNAELACMPHPVRTSVEEEIRACEAHGRFGASEAAVAKDQLSAYVAEGMPVDRPLMAGYLLIRDHMGAVLPTAMDLWWEQLNRYSRRDQISLPYVLWKTTLPTLVLTQEKCSPDDYFVRYRHRSSPLRDWWQTVYARRDFVWWCRMLYNARSRLLR